MRKIYVLSISFTKILKKSCLTMLNLVKETSQKSCLNLSFIQVWPIIRANDSDPVLQKNYFCLSQLLFVFPVNYFDVINGGRGHKRLWIDIHISITRRRVKVQKAYTMLQIDAWFCSWHLPSMMWSLKGSQKTDKQSWSESLRQKNNGKNDVLMWWTNKTDVSSCVCVIVSVLRGCSQFRE